MAENGIVLGPRPGRRALRLFTGARLFFRMSILILLIPALAAGFTAWLLSGILTGASIGLANRTGALAYPSDRSSHETATPRLGGIAIVWAMLIPLAVYLPLSGAAQEFMGFENIEPVPWTRFGGLFTIVLFAFLLGLVDDLKDLPAAAKFCGQLVIAAIVPFAGLIVHSLYIPFAGQIMLPPLAGGILAAAWVLLMMNVVNFTDGINGLAGRFAEVAGIAFVVATINMSWRTELVVVGAITIGAAAGFLNYNRGEDARTFMGDCGSQALGAWFAGVVLLFHTDRPNFLLLDEPLRDAFLAGVIIAWPLIFDVIWTLGRRILNGENPFAAHRTHLYQRYHFATGSHHERTLNSVSNMLYASGIAGIIYLRVVPSSAEELAVVRAAAWGALVALSVIWLMIVRSKESAHRY